MKQTILRHELVEYLPECLQEGVLYVSRPFNTAAHRCCCGCGQEVVTPLGPTGWQVTIDRDAVSLFPSVGNWSLPCRSHYWISRNKVVWAGQWTQHEINATRKARKHAIADAIRRLRFAMFKRWICRVWERRNA